VLEVSLEVSTSTVRAELRALARLAWPVATAQFGIVALGLVETAVVGTTPGTRGVLDLGGVALGRTIAFTSLTLGMGTAFALEPLAAQAIGAGDPARAWRALETSLGACARVWAICTAIAIATTYALVPFGIEHEVVDRARGFLLAQIPGSALMLAFLCGKTFLQAHGKTRPAVIAVATANVVNLVACNLLVHGDDALASMHLPRLGIPALGAVGAGIAASIASAVLASIVLVAAARQRAELGRPRVSLPAPSAEPVPLREVLDLGLPIGFQILAEVGVFGFVALLAGKLGSEVVAAHQIALGIASFTYMGALGISGATAVRVGLAVGARRSPRRPGVLGIAMGGVMMCVPAVLFAVFPGAPIALFTHDPKVTAIAVPLIRIAAVFQFFDGVQAVAGGALRGAGDAKVPFFLNVVSYWLVGFPLALLFGFGLGFGARGLWWGLTAGLVSAAILSSARFWRLVRYPVGVEDVVGPATGTNVPPFTS
jgi:MATE family multidrug resistance protein